VFVENRGIDLILGVCGSPRKKATDFILRQALETLEKSGHKTEFFGVLGKNISPCTHCDYCLKNMECKIKDDMFQLYPLLRDAQGLIIATPVYMGGLSAQTKIIMDRCRALLAADRNVFRYKVGMAIAVGGDRMGGQELAITQIMTFYILNEIIPVSGGSFGANLGATFWSKDTLDGVRKDDEGFRSLRKTLKRFTRLVEREQKLKIESTPEKPFRNSGEEKNE
jgi:multimeric flavodoxin WrbA